MSHIHCGVMFTLVTTIILCVVGCSGSSPSDTAILRIDSIAAELEEFGVHASYVGFDKVLGTDIVAVSIDQDVTDIPVTTISAIPIAVSLTFSSRDVAVADVQCLAETSNVIELRFLRSRLSSEALTAISSLGSIRSLAFAKCKLDISGWALPSALQFLEVEEYDSADKLLVSCKRNSLANLESLSLRGSSVSVDAMKQVASCAALRELFLSETKLDDDMLSQITGLAKLQRLELSGTRVSDNGVRKIGRLRSLQQLSLRNTNVSNEIVNVLTALPELFVLDVASTKVDPQRVKQLKPTVLINP